MDTTRKGIETKTATTRFYNKLILSGYVILGVSFFIARSISKPINLVNQTLQHMSGDLNRKKLIKSMVLV